jgi:hypothetical protein
MNTAKNLMKKMLSGILVLVILAGALTVPGTEAKAAAATYETAVIPTISSVEDLDTISAMYTASVSVSTSDASEAELYYFKFSLDSDSWVYMTGSMSANNHDGGQVHLNLYADEAMTNMVGEYGWGYWESVKDFMAFLKKGTYYGRISARHANYERPFVSNLNVIAGAIPTSALVDAKVTVSADKKKATVSFADALGEKAKDVQYRAGKVSKTYNDSQKHWKYTILGNLYGPNDAYVLEADDGQYSFTVKKNGDYTVRLEDIRGNYYSQVVSVSGIKTAALTVSGVRNGKTYSKAVTIKFSSAGTGIKSATLNGKSITSGTTVSARGSYTLKVTDKSGNKKVIKFKIK